MASYPMLFLFLAATILASPSTTAGPAFYVEPTSGRPVTAYTATLAVSGGERREIAIPGECDEVRRLLAEGQADTARVLDRRLWIKIEEDCWFDRFLNRHPGSEITDFVSGYDFMNARVEDLPVEGGCSLAEGDAGTPSEASCRTASSSHGLVRNFPIPGTPPTVATSPPGGSCRLKNGVFYGELFIGRDGLHCMERDGSPSLRLIAVDFADVNGDRFLDAVLRFVPIGPNALRAPLILPLTRTEADGRFHVPAGLP